MVMQKFQQKFKTAGRKNLEEYLLKREQIKCLVQLVDGRHELQKRFSNERMGFVL